MKKVFITGVLLSLAGCDQYYRYPCQNPENWDKPQCQKPLCEVNRDCPDLILDKRKANIDIPGSKNRCNIKPECTK